MPILTYRITLEEPTIVTSLNGEPNSSISFDYLPGSTLRGMMISAYIRHHHINSNRLDAADSKIRRLFFSNATRYLNGYLVEPTTNQRTLPVPTTWSRPKAGGYDIRDSLSGERNEEESKTVKDYWVVIEEPNIAYLAKTNPVINVHNDRNRRAGRALPPGQNRPKIQRNGETQTSDDDGTVFRYDALAAGQTFEAVILCDGEGDAAILSEVLHNMEHAMLGGAVSAGYGRVRVYPPLIHDDWEEAPAHPHPENLLTITLLSDVILRDRYGHCRTDVQTLVDALQLFLGENIALKKADDGTERAYLGVTVHGGFNRKWGLPLPQFPALKMGSVIQLSGFTGDDDSVYRLMREGIGERRNEGFGRVAVNWQPFDLLQRRESAKSSYHQWASDQKLTVTSQDLLNRTHQRVIQARVENDALRLVYRKRYRIQGPITRTQLMRLRGVIKNEIRKDQPSLNCFDAFLRTINGKEAAKQLDQTKIGTANLRGWLLNPEFKELGGVALGEVVILMMMDAVLERAIKTRKREETRHV